MRVRLLISMLCVFAVAAPAAGAAPLRSDNVSVLGTYPDAAGAISARFIGSEMYVSTAKGLHIYDVSKPAEPKRVGVLALPHFENEDVDAGGDTVIVSNDPSEGVGLIYVIDVSDPASPRIRSVFANGFIEGNSQLAPLSEALGNGTAGGGQSETGHIANCIQACNYLWMTGTAEGIAVIDLRDKDNPKYAGEFKMPIPKGGKSAGFTHDVFVDKSGIGWVTGEDGTFGYDTSNALSPTLVYRSDENVLNSGESGPSGEGAGPLDFLHHNSIRTDIQLAPLPGAGTPGTPVSKKSPAAKKKKKAKRKSAFAKCKKLKGKKRKRCVAKAKKRRAAAKKRGKVRAKKSTTLGGLGDVVAITEEDYTRPTCKGQGSLQTWQIVPGENNSDGSTKLKLLDQWETELNELITLTGRAPATANCSAHWFDEAGGLLAQGWYDQGVRFLDINDPKNIRQVGYYATAAGSFWGAYYAPTDPKREIVYALDVASGMDVIKIDRGSGAAKTARASGALSAASPRKASETKRMKTVKAPIRKKSRVSFRAADDKWGMACPVPVVSVR